MSLQIYVYRDAGTGGFLELDPGTVLDMERPSGALDEELNLGEYSLPIDIPLTPGNKKLIGFLDELPKNNRPSWFNVTLYDNFLPVIQNGKMTLLNKQINQASKVSVSIAGAKGIFGAAIKNKKLKDLPWQKITWEGMNSRAYATAVMKGVIPRDDLAFAPVVIEDFFDKEKNYNDEFLVKDTVNYVMPYAGSWVFDRPKSSAPAEVEIPGREEHTNYRTVPFFKMRWVFENALRLCGYTAKGNYGASDKLSGMYIFNSYSLENYFDHVDHNRKIEPGNHMPDMLISEFLQRFCKAMNCYPTFPTAGIIEFKERKQKLTGDIVFNLTPYLTSEFESVYTEAEAINKFTLDYDFDSDESYASDRIADPEKLDVIATVNARSELGAIGSGETTDKYAFVVNENMYYRIADSTVSPVIWDAAFEALHPYKYGEDGEAYTTGVGVLATYVEFDETAGIHYRRSRLAARIRGSYINDKHLLCHNPVKGLTVLYIAMQNIDSLTQPISFNNSVSPTGNTLNIHSLNLHRADGIFSDLIAWRKRLSSVSETHSFTYLVDEQIFDEMNRAELLLIRNNYFLPVKHSYSRPLDVTAKVDAVNIT